jgi:hypothetical protein
MNLAPTVSRMLRCAQHDKVGAQHDRIVAQHDRVVQGIIHMVLAPFGYCPAIPIGSLVQLLLDLAQSAGG